MNKIRVSAANLSGAERKSYVTRMFDSIAGNYDFLNHLLSGGIDILWRKKAARLLKLNENSEHLDIASGTGDFAFEINKRYNCTVVATDISKEMLNVAEAKREKRKRHKISFSWADAEELKFENNRFDSVTIGFGIRNFGDKEKALDEIHRVLKTDGQLIILEFSKIENAFVRSIFNLYFRYILPSIGRLFSSDKEAYTYLPDSVHSFYTKKEFVEILSKRFTEAQAKNLTLGVCTMFLAKK